MSSVLFEKRDGVGYITLNRPEQMNAMNAELLGDLQAAAIACDRDPEVRAVLIAGKGRMFCAGGDLNYFREAGDRIGVRLAELTRLIHGAVSTLARMHAPVVTAVHGAAAGGGFSFAISGDVVIAAQSAKFTLAYTANGLSPDGGSTWFLPRLVGLRRARELMLTNRVLGATEALDIGIIDRVVPDADLQAQAEAQARAFATGATRAYASVKKLLAGTFSESLETQMELESRHLADRASDPDGQEGIHAFMEKRKPRFGGR